MLLKILGRIRFKLQTERTLKGLAILAAGVLLIFLASGLLLSKTNFSDTAIIWIRIVGVVILAGLAYRYFLRPLLFRPSAKQVARFLEERDPSLQERLSTAIELSQDGSQVHPGIRDLVLKDADAKFARRRQPKFYFPRASLGSLVTSVLVALILSALIWDSQGLYSYSLAKLVGSDEADVPLYSIAVQPGHVKVGKHADLQVRAALKGFTSDEVKIFVQYSGQPQWEEALMDADRDTGESVFLFIDVRDPFTYYVEADGIQSDRFDVAVAALPRISKMRITLQFPKYTGLGETVLEEEGDIRALKGTKALFSLETDAPVESAKIKLDSGPEIVFEKTGPQRLSASLTIEKDDYYRIHLADLEGVWNPATDENLIEAVLDQPPILRFTEPGRDRKVTNLEEVFLQVKAEDDYGISRLHLHYTVNGEDEKQLRLDHPRYSRSFSTGHTFFMEEYELQPGDFISYWASAKDAVTSSTTDIYFLEVEPFDKEFSQSQAQQGGQGQPPLQLAKRQKQIIAATFKLERDRPRIPKAELDESGQTLALVQQQLQLEAQEIVDRIMRRGAAASDPRFVKMLEYMNTAMGHMTPAHDFLNKLQTKEALPVEQKAYQFLLRAEALFNEVQVSFSQDPSSGGASAEQLADLVDLELDKKKNQYETLQQNRAEKQEKQVDEALDKLKELARRQEQQVERMKRQASMQSGSGGGQQDQSQLIEEAEKLARELERLSRQKQDPQLSNVARQLRQAARDMRSAQSKGRRDSDAMMKAQQALERLQKARNNLTQRREQQVQDKVSDLQRQVQDLQDKQAQVLETNQALAEKMLKGQLSQDFMQQRRELNRLKGESEQDLRKLEGDLHQTARQVESKSRDAAKSLKSAAHDVKDERITDQMQVAGNLSNRGLFQQAQPLERSVARDLARMAEKIDKAKEAMSQAGQGDPSERLQQAQNRLGSVIEDLDSLRQRAQEAARRAGEQGEDSESQAKSGDQEKQGDQSQGEQGREGEQGQEGQEGQEGQQGKDGKPSQEGRQGQEGQEGQGKQPGQGDQSGPSGEDASQKGQQSDQGREPSPRLGQPGMARAAGLNASTGIDPRQIGRELHEFQKDLREVARLLGSNRDLAREAELLRRALAAINPKDLFSDPEEVKRLRSKIIHGLQDLELRLNRALSSDDEDQVRLVNPDEVPPQYRRKVEDYYKALATKKNN